MKTCSRCDVEKDLKEFRKNSKRPDGLSVWCKGCFAEYDRDRYQNGDRDRKIRNRKKTNESNRESIWSYLLENPCIGCGNNDPRVLEFDHRDPAEKRQNVSDMLDLSWKTIKDEIDKCDVRCANCHKIRTQEQFKTWRFIASQ